MSDAISLAGRPEAWRNIRPALPALCTGLVIWGVLFQSEIAAALLTWSQSTAYSHCYFVLPIAAYLAWDRREPSSAVPLSPTIRAAMLGLPIGIGWLAAERMGIMEGRQLAAIALMQILFLATLGWRLYWSLSAPLLYLFFLVPFGAFVTPSLQAFTVKFMTVGLEMLRIPYVADNYLIEIPEGRFYVAEACAGLRFLIASVAFGVLYGLLMYRSPMRRAMFVGASVVIPIVANGLRGLGIVVLGHILGSAQAAATDHVLYGWLFFSLVILLLTLAGLPFREIPLRAQERLPAIAAGRASIRLGLAATVATLVAAVGPAAASAIDRSNGGTAARPVAPMFVIPAGCRPSAHEVARGAEIGADGTASVVTRLECNDLRLTVSVISAPASSAPGVLVAARRNVTLEFSAAETEASVLAVPAIDPTNWRLVAATDPNRVTASALWLDGSSALGGLAERFEQAWRSVVGGGTFQPVLVAVSCEALPERRLRREREASQDAIHAFLTAQPGLTQQVAALSRVGE